MLLISILGMLYLLTDPVFTTSQHNVDGQTLQAPTKNLAGVNTFPNGLSPSNRSLIPLNGLTIGASEVRCHARYGLTPNIDDCWNAIHYVQRSEIEVTFAERDTSPGPRIFRLPFRLMGDKAQCYFQPVLEVGERTGSASFNEIRTAAAALISQCGIGAGQGGIASHIGGDDHLALVLGTYQPNIKCSGTLTSWASCRDILSGMPAMPGHVTLGPSTDPPFQVTLPKTLSSDDNKCHMKIWTSDGFGDSTTWYKIWEVVTAVYSVCARHAQGGSFSRFGDIGRLSITLSDSLTVEEA
ncbi:hypothetical protein N7G274_006888 [Stereocaulon virgatum]|uniref:Uncharacterized protein n=1 Tax=Stereocaulon virgatum TaxID=373712 RepID=A0ABR4A3K5_9LECA